MTRSGLRGWESTQRQTALGAVESEQRVRLVRPEDLARGDVGGDWRRGPHRPLIVRAART